MNEERRVNPNYMAADLGYREPRGHDGASF